MDSRFPTYYLQDRRVMKMTPEQFRLFVLATAWAVSNMTDGHIEDADLPLISFANQQDALGLTQAGVWTRTDEGWLITDFQKTQTSAALLEASLVNRRKADAERQKKKYDRDKQGDASSNAKGNANRMQSALQTDGKGYGKAVAPASQVLDPREDSGNPREGTADVPPNTQRTPAEHLPLGVGNPLPLPLPLDKLPQTPVSMGDVTQTVTRNTEPDDNPFQSSREPHVRNEGKERQRQRKGEAVTTELTIAEASTGNPFDTAPHVQTKEGGGSNGKPSSEALAKFGNPNRRVS